MKVCIVGAVGGFIGTRLEATGCAEVSALARGAGLKAWREQGWRMRCGERLRLAPARASDQVSALGLQELVVAALLR